MEQSRPWAKEGEGQPEAQPPGGPTREPLDEDLRPATVGELRGQRRWTMVAVVWAVAASAIALVAQLTRVRRALDRRIDPLRSQIEELPTSDDLQRLDRRVRQGNDRVSEASARARGAEAKVDGMDQRIEEIEQRLEEVEARQQEQAAEQQEPAEP